MIVNKDGISITTLVENYDFSVLPYESSNLTISSSPTYEPL